MPDLKLTQISIYPVKSLGGISLSTALVLGKGLQYDRRWMLVDRDGKAMTQRVYPTMALFKLSLGEDKIAINFRGHNLDLLLQNHSLSSPLQVTVWDDTVDAFEVSPSASEWFSDLLGVRCKLVYFPEENERPVNPAYQVNDEHVSLADAYPFLIIGQSTFDELNGRLTETLPINRFRPNFVFSGGKPFDEDGWRNVKIGSVRFVGVKLCERCVLTTVNQDTAEKGIEPLRTLATYRKKDNKIYFGQNLVTLDPHQRVSVGDVISLE